MTPSKYLRVIIVQHVNVVLLGWTTTAHGSITASATITKSISYFFSFMYLLGVRMPLFWFVWSVMNVTTTPASYFQKYLRWLLQLFHLYSAFCFVFLWRWCFTIKLAALLSILPQLIDSSSAEPSKKQPKWKRMKSKRLCRPWIKNSCKTNAPPGSAFAKWWQVSGGLMIQFKQKLPHLLGDGSSHSTSRKLLS